jgi:hypothetical protein
MPLLTPPPSKPQRGVRATFNLLLDGFIAWLVDTFYNELLALVAGLNSLAMGGAYAIPFAFDTGTAAGDPGAGEIRLNNSSHALVTAVYISTTSQLGKVVAAYLDSMNTSTSAVKGQIKLTSQTDQNKYLVLGITGEDTSQTFYRSFTVQFISSTNPTWTAGEALLLGFTRTGDKGDIGLTGPINTYPIIWARDEKTSGTGAGVAASGWQTRALGASKKNTISGASLASNQVTLPAGTYRYRGHAPSNGNGAHQAALYNVTDAAYASLGTSMAATTTSGIQTLSHLIGEITIAASKVFELRQYNTNSGNSLGSPAATGQVEVYAEIIFEKVA